MPAILTHHIFGLELYQGLKPLIGESDAERDAFLLGNIGPDPLFCLRMLPHGIPYRDVGHDMHVEDPTSLLSAMHEHFVARPGKTGPTVLKAYALGFVCHYLVDSLIHPLIYAEQHALCTAGIEGLDLEHGYHHTHSVIETELDEYVLTTRLNTTVATFVPHRETLRCPYGALNEISAAFPPVVSDVYGLPMLPTSFRSSVRIYRAAQLVLDAKRDGLRSHIDYARLVVNQYHHILMFTHADTLRYESFYANNDHLPWHDLFDPDVIIDASFDDLYAQAFECAQQVLPQFAQLHFPESACEDLTQRINFRGQRIN